MDVTEGNEMQTIATRDAIRWYHHALALPLKGLSALNLGPLGGENSISVIIEAILQAQRGETVDFPLSKTEQFFVRMLTGPNAPNPAPLLAYRQFNHRAQQEVLNRRGDHRLGVIWLGGGVFTLEHPLLQFARPDDWQIWTDANPKVVRTAQALFDEMQRRMNGQAQVQSLILPQDVAQLNEHIRFLAAQGVQEIVLQAFGMFYVLTGAENAAWLRQLERPKGVTLRLIVDAMSRTVDLMPAVMIAFHNQRMVYYERADIEALLRQTQPDGQIVWELPRSEQTYGQAVWLLELPPT